MILKTARGQRTFSDVDCVRVFIGCCCAAERVRYCSSMKLMRFLRQPSKYRTTVVMICRRWRFHSPHFVF